ncbi:hypothetical protein [Phormidium tenue]|uniref:Uncharacterized protein n=1 Tax=Phormidium tenue NIES-30 TaxID=549789 RepID=A0A1U7J748_9CYAN|nr:hypothetical protein [Phormidium tenue]MBD2231643.1 hypothetical protein [Phormidium tenue FACHB-1052]OKH48984.1 hypothetical protein NIES30_07325 [Phormidium tenue NIES-30]
MTNPTDPTPQNNPTPQNEILEIVKGMLLLLGCHAVAGALIFLLGLLVAVAGVGDYAFAVPWVIGAAGFLFWQLLYVIPLVITLRRRGYIAMAKGVIITAVLTALVNGACFVSMFGFV